MIQREQEYHDIKLQMNSRTTTVTRTISFTSGKGGVGKSSLLVNTAHLLVESGYKILILDGDLGMSNIDVMLSLRPELNIQDVIRGRARLEEIVIEAGPQLSLIPGGSGLYDLQNLNIYDRQKILDQVSSLRKLYDYMLVDTSPGIAENVLYLNAAVDSIQVILTPDPSSITDAYALIKVLVQRYRQHRFHIICNQVRDEAEGLKLFARLHDTAARFLHVSLNYSGSVPTDPNLRQSVRFQQVLSKSQPQSAAINSLRKIIKNILNDEYLQKNCKGNIQFFWERLVQENQIGL